MTFTEQMTAELVKPLDSSVVVKPDGKYGPKGDYIEGWHAINELNRIFGFGGWGYEIDLKQESLAVAKVAKKDYKSGNMVEEDQWQAAYTCICTLTVHGVIRQAVGFGSGFAKAIGDAIEGATKEAETDSLKRAARTFGNPFGLALYDKSRANVQEAPPQSVVQFLDGLTKAFKAKEDTAAYYKTHIAATPNQWRDYVKAEAATIAANANPSAIAAG